MFLCFPLFAFDALHGSAGLTAFQAKHNQERAVAPREENFIRFKAYGDQSKQPLVIVPGLDGATAFFTDVVPELTLNVRFEGGPSVFSIINMELSNRRG